MTTPFYVTTPIYYVNAVPHLGTFYTTVVADSLARYHRARHGAAATHFLTGLDEHGLKIERIARERGVEPASYCDQMAETFQATWKKFSITNDDFMRTTSLRHKAAVAEMWQRMTARGDIELREYDGLYCVGCEESKTEDDVVTENGEKLCPTHRKPVERVKEKNYFFLLSRYQQFLLDHYAANPGFVRPESRLNEVREFVKGGLRDLSVSRMSVKWGIPVPNDPAHVIYVWIDALTNYVTALGGPSKVAADSTDVTARGRWANAHHLIGKDILRFHAVYWPAMLQSAGLPQPKMILSHGFLTVKGQKISKSMPATRVDPVAIADELGVDPLRYFVLREYTLGGDGDFTYESLFQRYESDLGNDLGNLANRTISMAQKFQTKGSRGILDATFHTDLCRDVDEASQSWETFAPSRALEATWRLIRRANAFIDSRAPWKLAKEGKIAELEDVISSTLEMIRVAALLTAPVMPTATDEILRQIGRAADSGTWPAPRDGAFAWPGGTLGDPRPVFPRIEPDRQQALIAKWVGEPVAPTASVATPVAPPVATAEITIDEFAKVDLRVAKVLTAERVPKTDKLLKLSLDLGNEQRTVVSGIAGAYAPEALVGRTVIYLANLKPAKIRGVLSQGMILAAGDAEVLALSAVDRDVPAGTKIR